MFYCFADTYYQTSNNILLILTVIHLIVVDTYIMSIIVLPLIYCFNHCSLSSPITNVYAVYHRIYMCTISVFVT